MADDLVRLMQVMFLPRGLAPQETPWQPAADIYQTHSGWLIKFDLAGVRLQDVTLIARGRRLTLRGCRRDECSAHCRGHYLMEIAYSSFERTIELPFELDPAGIATEYQDGMLLVRIQTEI